MDTRSADMVVIGGGPGGYKVATHAARGGAKVVLVERGRPGGTCLNEGCVPMKALLRIARLAGEVEALQGRGLTGPVRTDFRAAWAHKDAVCSTMRSGFPVWLRQLGVKWEPGTARLLAPGRVEVTPGPEEPGAAHVIACDRVVIATGARPRTHPACPVDGLRILTSHNLMHHLKKLPKSLLCLGGGAVGTEVAFLMHRFGVRVAIAEQNPHLLEQPGIPLRAREALARKFDRLGVAVHLNVSVARVRARDEGLDVTFTDGRSEFFERILVAIGRIPVTGGLGLEQTGIEINNEGFILTNNQLETSGAGVYAVGDVKPGPMTATAALHDAKVAAANAVEGARAVVNYHRVPTAIDSALEIAAVGLTEEQAEAAGFTPDVARFSFGASAKARARHDYEGFIEVVHDEETGQMLGGCVVGPDAGEQIHMLAAACQSDQGMWLFDELCYAHPSLGEEMGNTIDPYTAAFRRSQQPLFPRGIYSPRPAR